MVFFYALEVINIEGVRNRFASFVEFERNLIRDRTEAGRAAARARGRLGGRPEKLGKKEGEVIKSLAANNPRLKILLK